MTLNRYKQRPSKLFAGGSFFSRIFQMRSGKNFIRTSPIILKKVVTLPNAVYIENYYIYL